MSEVTLICFLAGLVLIRALLHFGKKQFSFLSDSMRVMINETIDGIVLAGTGAVFLIAFVVRSFYIPSASMLPTLQVRDLLMVERVSYNFVEPSRGDVIVFTPVDTSNDEIQYVIKRIVAVEGDVVWIHDGKLFINNQEQSTDYTYEPMAKNFDFGPHKVAKDHVFMMGDNRNNSKDSRFWGDLPLSHVIGRARFIYFPPSRIGEI